LFLTLDLDEEKIESRSAGTKGKTIAYLYKNKNPKPAFPLFLSFQNPLLYCELLFAIRGCIVAIGN
jgi:hypothetical protein